MSANDRIIPGAKKLDELLKTLPLKVEKNVMGSALRAGAAVYRKEVRERVPVQLGPLKKSVRISSKTVKGVVSSSVKAGNRKAWYALLVEFGTKPHKIKPKAAKALEIGGQVVKEVEHPGAQPKPYMRPGADAAHAAALAAVVKKLRERLTLAGLDLPPDVDPP